LTSDVAKQNLTSDTPGASQRLRSAHRRRTPAGPSPVPPAPVGLKKRQLGLTRPVLSEIKNERGSSQAQAASLRARWFLRRRTSRAPRRTRRGGEGDSGLYLILEPFCEELRWHLKKWES